MTAMTKAEFQKAAARFTEQRDFTLRDIEEMVNRARTMGAGMTHLAHNLSARVTELAGIQARLETMEQMAAFAE